VDRPVESSAAPRRRKWALALSLALFALVAAALFAATMLIFSTIRTQQAERRQTERTDQVLAALGEIGRAAVNAETGQRGYFITLDRRYLAPYELAQASYRASLARVRSLVSDRSEPRTAALLARVEALTQDRFAELARSVALVEKGEIIEAQQAILSDEGQRLMLELRATLGELERIERARLAASVSETAQLEAKLLPLLTVLAGVICVALGLGLWLVVRSASAEAQAEHAAELAAARDRADLLARELNHRVKNLFAVILAIVRMSSRDSPAAKPVIDALAERIHALARAHDLTQGSGGIAAEAEVDLARLVATATAPYRSPTELCEIEGPPVSLPGTMAMPLGLVLHELVTNAVKHGAWSNHGGLIRIAWRRHDGKLLLHWREHGHGGAPPENGRGFGSQLIESAARQLHGTIERVPASDGLELRMSLPLEQPG
jgi:two-component sensor histidine kinase/CHASE3 domain sensor protein